MLFSTAASLVGLLPLARGYYGPDLTPYVAPLTGTANGGNMFPGATLPFGMVKLGPDLYTGSDSYSGYQPTGNLTGFSLLHESGTGGAPKYGVVSQMPWQGNLTNPLVYLNATRLQGDYAEVGYYRSVLGPVGGATTVELAAAERAGMLRYTFLNEEEGTGQKHVVVDVSHTLFSYRGQGLGQNYLGGNMTVSEEQDGTVRYYGSGSYDNGWNRAPKWTVYFCGTFDSSPSWRTFVGVDNTSSTLQSYDQTPSVSSDTKRLGAVFTFNETQVTSRVGVSFVSASQACGNLDEQIPAGTQLGHLVSAAKSRWNEEILGKVTVGEEEEPFTKELLYTMLYGMNLLPQNKTGENPLWSGGPCYDDIFTLWDLSRCSTALFHILSPSTYTEYLNSLISVFHHTGYAPDARSSFWNGATQGGSNSDNVMADAYSKGVSGVKWTDAYQAMVKNAEVVPPNTRVDPRDPTGSTSEGRSALPDWLELGYITPRFGRSVSRAVEYSVNDYSVSSVARGLGLVDDANKYLNRSRNWRNHWNPNVTSLGFSGFVVPRNSSGFIAQDPMSCGGCYWADYYYEALPWEYSFNAQHDIAHLISLSGGRETFVNRLIAFFTPGLYPGGNAQFNNTLFNPGNEPSFNTPYLFNFVGRQDLSVKYSRETALRYYSPTVGGIPGNSDAGAMQTWILWNMIGLYPMTGQSFFLIGSPWFNSMSICLGDDKYLNITSTGGSYQDNYYVQSLKVNGETWDQTWIEWDDIFAYGGTMDFVLGGEPQQWATGPDPPSPGTETS